MTISNSSNQPIAPSLERASDYLKRGLAPIPVALHEKKPIIKNWNDLRLSEADLPGYFSKPCNIGIVLGDASGGIVDVDIDTEAALILAAEFLPETGMVFGRSSRPASHYIYKLSGNIRRAAFNDPNGNVIVELRGDGHHTVFPGSIHESGEQIVFVKDDTPKTVTLTDLTTAAAQIAIATIILPFWTKGCRHDLALSLSGMLANCDWTEEKVEHLLTVVAAKAGDDQLDDRVACVRDSFAVEPSRRSGLSKLRLMVSAEVAHRIQKLATLEEIDSPSIVPDSTSAEVDTDIGAADAFANKFDSELLFCEQFDSWFKRTGQIYLPAGATELQGIAMDFLSEIAQKQGPGAAKRLKSRNRVSSTIFLARSRLAIDYRQLDSDRQLIGCADNRIISLKTGKPVSLPKVIVTKRVNTSYDEHAECPSWKKFLLRIFANDKDLIDFIKRAVGYTLTGLTDEQCIFLLIGNGANGKSTFINVLMKLFGDYGGTTPMQCLMVQKSQQTNDLAALVGKRFVSASEGEFGQNLAESKIKQMTGGDQISCRRLYHEFFDYEPQFKLWLATNNLPKVSGTDDGIWRRIHVVEFPITIPKEERDGKLATKLASELPGILNWALEGLAEWGAVGLNPPAVVTNATARYRSDSDTVGQFISACCRCDPSVKILAKDIYDAYTRWAEQSGYEPVSKIVFGKTLSQKGFSNIKGRTGNIWGGLVVIV